MADPELVQALDYILNRSDEVSIEVLAAAVVRRRRDIAMFGGAVDVPDPRRMADELIKQVNASIGGGIESVKQSVRDMAVRIVREQAPELTDAQIAELCRAWIPENAGGGEKPSTDLMRSMIEQFVSFSQGTMKETVDQNLRQELGEWPERYWKAFPPVVRSLITDFLKNRLSEKDFFSKIGVALEMG